MKMNEKILVGIKMKEELLGMESSRSKFLKYLIITYTLNMTMADLEQAILDIIKEVYCARYTAKLKVKELKDGDEVIGYHLELGMNNVDKPITINKEGTVEDFLKCIKDELRLRHLHYTTYSLGYKACN
jgi:hypothetical protein